MGKQVNFLILYFTCPKTVTAIYLIDPNEFSEFMRTMYTRKIGKVCCTLKNNWKAPYITQLYIKSLYPYQHILNILNYKIFVPYCFSPWCLFGCYHVSCTLVRSLERLRFTFIVQSSLNFFVVIIQFSIVKNIKKKFEVRFFVLPKN